MNILLVENDRILAETVIDALKEEGHDVRWSYDIDALLWAREGWPEVVLLDLMLEPYLSGSAILSYLYNHPSTQHIPVVLATGVRDTTHALDLGGRITLLKPYDMESLRFALEHVTKGKIQP